MPETDPPQTTIDPLDDLNLVNAGYVADLYEQYRADPASVDALWRSQFDKGWAGFEPIEAPPATANGDQGAKPAAQAAAPPSAE